jgi:dual specificity phosphatase 12
MDKYISLPAAQSQNFRSELGITHMVSICPEHKTEFGPNHLVILISDMEHEDLLIHLPKSCEFIQTALDAGGKILVHCAMGISRSPTVVCAYSEHVH